MVVGDWLHNMGFEQYEAAFIQTPIGRDVLDIVAAVAQLETPAGEPLAVRIGIATGLVVIGDLKGKSALREHTVVGDTPNIAARLQTLGEPGTVVVAASTRRLIGDLFR